MLFDNWKIGKKGKDNGVLILLDIKERRWNIRGELRFYNQEDVSRENKMQKMDTDETIAWVKKGLARLGNNMRF